jgi:predicted membrane channel-forming protein YqfA (hemolysin III family)
MNHWLSIALIAYLIGAAIEGVSTARQLSHSLPELTKDRQDEPSEPTNSLHENWHIFVVIAFVSVCGACIWPCRLFHRLIKENGLSEDS